MFENTIEDTEDGGQKITTPDGRVIIRTPEQVAVGKAQAEQMFGKTDSHAPSKPTRLDHDTESGIPSGGAPPAQGPNISKEESEFAANAGGAEPEKTPASTEVK